jgi:hypothetical protein
LPLAPPPPVGVLWTIRCPWRGRGGIAMTRDARTPPSVQVVLFKARRRASLRSHQRPFSASACVAATNRSVRSISSSCSGV